MAQDTTDQPVAPRANEQRVPVAPAGSAPGGSGRLFVVGRMVALVLGALAFLFPFYYMVVGSFKAESDGSLRGALPVGPFTTQNYSDINGRVDLIRSLGNSGIFTGGVLLATVVFGVLAGYALAQLHFRGRGLLFGAMLLVLVIPFQLLIIPLYVMIVRSYGLADNYLGMILPFAINSTAVFVFRQFFLTLPADLFAAARIDGASELRILWSVALPLVRPALLTAVLLTFIGPWNEFLWPFLITKQADMQPLAVSLANYISTASGEAENPYGAILAGACVLALPAVVLYILFQRYFVSTNIGSGVKG
jgi:multiple sugar transport system permease protein